MSQTITTTPAKAETIRCRLHVRPIKPPANLAALNEVFAALPSASILGGNVAKRSADGFSYWAAEPKEVFEFTDEQEDPFAALQAALDKYKLAGKTNGTVPKGMFRGGWLGYFSYELGRYIEKLPRTTLDDLRIPLIRLCFYDRVLAYDHHSDSFWAVALEQPDDSESPEEKLAWLRRLVEESRSRIPSPPRRAELDKLDISKFRCNIDRDYYIRAVKKILRYIYDGTVYQVNFSQRFDCDWQGRAIDLFHWQNHHNPSGYAAYIDAGRFQVVSASPEMFATITDGWIQTKPIKGTRRRLDDTHQNAAANEANFSDLLHSEKERAELNMIIDLERNDIARICEPGTRKVIQPRTIEAHPTVFHAVATIAGRLKQGISFCDILRGIFPGGSITGAPKVSAMEIIDETEPTARGVYTGSIGFIGLDGSACLNIAIRTIIITGRKAFAQTGGGIVADSDSQDEWDETITKARALLAGIEATNRR